MVDEPTKGVLYGSTVAAPYIAKTLETVLPYLGVTPIYTEEEEKLFASDIPNYIGLEAESAVSFAESRGLAVTVVGEGKYVTDQSPKAESLYHGETGKIIFYTDDTKKISETVPDVVGKTLTEANRAITDGGFNLCIGGAVDVDGRGGAVVVSQSPAAGTRLESGGVVSIELRYMVKDD
jgi:stage V sporulation protein D (sporulation-specific penicillin-binding protein)